MKTKKHIVAIFLLFFITLFSCENSNFIHVEEVKTKKEYLEFTKSIDKLLKKFKDNKISKKEYAKQIENFGDVFVESKTIIPAEKRYKMSIQCYKEALKYDKNNKELREKLKKQTDLFRVINH